MSSHADLVNLLAKLSFRRGDFVLSSGIRSPYYVDARRTTMHPQGLRLIGELGFQAIQAQEWHPDAIGGLTLGADPVAYAISYYSASTTVPLRAFTVRKEPKQHGAVQQIEGPFQPLDVCVVIEDVITTGSSALKAIEVVKQAGASVVGVLAVVDRQEGGTSAICNAGIPAISLVSVSELASS